MNDLSEAYMRRAKADVAITISQVERLLASDPRLPRLTRGEIEELFENVTKEEYEHSLMVGDQERARHMRALMLVLPYNTNTDNNGNLEELYTRPPVTKMVDTGIKPKPQPILFDPPSGKVKIVSSKYRDTNIIQQPQVKPTTSTVIYTTTPVPTTTTTFRPVIQKKIRPVKTQIKRTQQNTQPTFHAELNFYPKEKKATTKFSSHYSANASPFKLPTHEEFPAKPIRGNIVDMLATIGLYPNEKNNNNNNRVGLIDSKPEASELLQIKPTPSPEFLKYENPTTLVPEIVRKIITTRHPIKRTTTPSPELETTTIISTTKKPEITPEIFQVLSSIGILKESKVNEQPEERVLVKKSKLDDLVEHDSNPMEFKPIPESLIEESLKMRMEPEFAPDFSSFKPLKIENRNTNENIDGEFEDFLKSFGLIDNKRQKKSMTKNETQENESETTVTSPKTPVTITTETSASTVGFIKKFDEMKEMPDVQLELVPFKMAHILDNIGITQKSNHNYEGKKPKKIFSSKAHGFRPPAHTKSTTEDDFAKLHQLLETIRHLDSLNSNITDDQLSQLDLGKYNLSEPLLAQGPNPVDHTEIESKKNEIKRQNDNEPVRISLNLDESSSPKASELKQTDINSNDDTTTTTTTTTTTSSDDDDPRSNLEDSFSSGSDPVDDTPLPPPRRSGFYFLTDINSFLEVGEDPDKVEVRYERKYGDPSRFLPVTVP